MLRAILSLAVLLVVTITSRSQLVPPDTTEGRTSITYDNEAFANFSSGDGGAGFVKFAIILSDPTTVYFQDSNLHPFHYSFATQHLEPFLGLFPSQFDDVSLTRDGQQVVLGAIIFPPFGGPREYGIQFIGLDPYPKEDVKAWFETTKAVVNADPGAVAIYIPTFEQKAQANADREWFASQGIEVDSIERWIRSDAIYADGWAFGRLVRVPGNQIASAYTNGLLKPTDVLLTDGVPSEVPFVAGILTESAATPNSHVAILARNQGIPFAWISKESERTRVNGLVGGDVLLRAFANGATALRVTKADESLDPKLANQIRSLKTPGKVKVTPRKPYGKISADAATLVPADIKYFGGKAANFGLLRRIAPDHSPRAIAFSFDLWDQYLSNVNPDSGLTLREEIDNRLRDFTYPPDFSAASEALEEIRDLIKKKVKFTDGQKTAILSALTAAGYEPTRMLRFRSSSNAEDTQKFSGAGLYESFNGCIADSTDGDDDGPCHCASGEADEKTVLRAIEKVFTSFYNDNAWLERLRFGIKESSVGMAVLVHENAPDESELANGVATLTRRRSENFGAEFEFKIVTQLGAVSVTNPEVGAKPEIVTGGQSGSTGDPFVFTLQHSDLVPLGGNVMFWEENYKDLATIMVLVADGYAALYPDKAAFTLDFEFKKLEPGALQIKQVRELPQPDVKPTTPILLNEPTEYVVQQGEFGDAFAFHRLKSILATDTRNTRLNVAALSTSLNRRSTFDFVLDGTRTTLTGGPFGWPAFSFSRNAGAQIDQWKVGSGPGRVTYKLKTTIPKAPEVVLAPVITQQDFTRQLSAIYKKPRPFINSEGNLKTRSSDTAPLNPRNQYVPDDLVQTRRIQTPGGVTIDPRFYWPDVSELGGFVIIKTLPLVAWEKTTITGLTTTPLVLTNDFAQTYAPGHHNFTEAFLYEPALDAGATPQQLAELQTANIQQIYVFHSTFGEGDQVKAIGFDGTLRAIP